MYRELLDQFFKENGVAGDVPSPPAMAHFDITLHNNPKASRELHRLMNQEVYKNRPDRETQAQANLAEIDAAVTCEDFIRLMRKHVDPINQPYFVNKVLAREDEFVPELVRRLKTSLNDAFIETATRILARSTMDFAQEMIGYFDDMRKPYAQGMALVILGFKADESRIPWLIEKYKKLKRIYRDETYSDGGYYALLEMESRFYPAEQARKK